MENQVGNKVFIMLKKNEKSFKHIINNSGAHLLVNGALNSVRLFSLQNSQANKSSSQINVTQVQNC